MSLKEDDIKRINLTIADLYKVIDHFKHTGQMDEMSYKAVRRAIASIQARIIIP